MSKIAFVYPGQGVQTVGMAQDFYENSVLSKEVFDKADQVLDFDIKKICFQENQEINDTEYTQAALVTTYLAITKEVESRGIKPDVAAGLSLGEYTALVAAGVKTRVLTAVRMEPIGEFYNKWKAIESMEAGEVVIMSAGTGNPFFTTDTGSSLRGIEIEADVMLKGTRVDGIYTADPEKDPTATKFDEITYDEVLKRGLKVMDLTATCMCKENNLPIIVFDMDTVGNLKKVMQGEEIGTLVHN